MENNNKRVVDNGQHINGDEKMKINMRAELDEHYTMLKECPKCGTRMIYAYGEVYECPKCGCCCDDTGQERVLQELML